MSNYQYTYNCSKLWHNIFFWCTCLANNGPNTKTKIIILEYLCQILHNFNFSIRKNAVSKIMQYLINMTLEYLRHLSYFFLALIDKIYRLANLLDTMKQVVSENVSSSTGNRPDLFIVKLSLFGMNGNNAGYMCRRFYSDF